MSVPQIELFENFLKLLTLKEPSDINEFGQLSISPPDILGPQEPSPYAKASDDAINLWYPKNLKIQIKSVIKKISLAKGGRWEFQKLKGNHRVDFHGK
ncbi:MAG: hypothetical protein ACE5G9_02335 [Nitrospinales bacterium]